MNTKLVGSAGWADSDGVSEGPVSRCIIRGNRELVLDATCDGYRYDVLLRRVRGSLYSGGWKCLEDRSDGNAECTLYRTDDEFLLFGKWLERGQHQHWWVKLQEVACFADEVSVRSKDKVTARNRARTSASQNTKRGRRVSR